jgi:pimeloyl-[acyl-carrier protein] methyl ester esterase
MALHVETFGSGPDLVLLHGWGMHGGVWGDFALRLAEHHRVHAIDLPGHGYSGWLTSLTQLACGTGFPLPPEEGPAVMPAGNAGIHGHGGYISPATSLSLDSCRAVLPGTLRASANPLPADWSGNPCRNDGKRVTRTALGGKTLLDQTLSALLENTPPRALWLGWSLGGTLAALLAAAHPERVRGLMLLACNLCFVRRPDWPWGMEEVVFERFATGIEKGGAAGLARFASLLCQGLDEARPVLKTLRERLASRPEPRVEALLAGLEWLRDLDARPALAGLKCPLLVAGGDRDALLPAAALEAAAALNPRGRFVLIPGASHVPFLSHREETLALVESMRVSFCP